MDDKSTTSYSVINPQRKLTGIIEEVEHSVELVHSPTDHPDARNSPNEGA